MSLLLKGAGPVGGFSPLSIAALRGWYDASDLGLANNDPVASWTDKSGLGNHLVQATSGKRPIYETAGLNSRACVSFDGTDDEVRAAFTLSIPYNLIFVGAYNAAWAAGQDWLIGGHTGNVGAFRSAAGTNYTGFDGAISHTIAYNPMNGARIHRLRLSGSSVVVLHLEPSTDSSSGTSATNAGGLVLGTNQGASGFASCKMQEVIAYAADISAGDFTALAAYLKVKWGTP